MWSFFNLLTWWDYFIHWSGFPYGLLVVTTHSGIFRSYLILRLLEDGKCVAHKFTSCNPVENNLMKKFPLQSCQGVLGSPKAPWWYPLLKKMPLAILLKQWTFSYYFPSILTSGPIYLYTRCTAKLYRKWRANRYPTQEIPANHRRARLQIWYFRGDNLREAI